jgi:Domain of unknown function (DUF4326)
VYSAGMNPARQNPLLDPLVVRHSKGTVGGAAAMKLVNTEHVAHRKDVLPSGEMTLRDGVVYIGRFQHWGPGRYFRASPFANPYTVWQYGLEESLRLFEERMRTRPDLLALLQKIDGKTLACWCAGKDGISEVLTAEGPHYCRGQVLLKLLREMREGESR